MVLKIKNILLLTVLLILTVSCTTTLVIKNPVLPKVSMTQISSIAVRGSARNRVIYTTHTTSTDSVILEKIKKRRNDRIDNDRDKSANVFVSKLETDIAQAIINSDVYDLVKFTRNQDPDLKPDAVIRIVLNEYKITDEYDNQAQLNRKLSINLTYELVRSRDNMVLSLKNFSEPEGSSAVNYGYDRQIKEIIKKIKETIISDILPKYNDWRVSLESDDENESIILGNKTTESKDYAKAIEIFYREFQVNHNIAGGINAALLQFYLGRRAEASKTINAVIQFTGSQTAKKIRNRFQSIIDNERLIKMIGKNKTY